MNVVDHGSNLGHMLGRTSRAMLNMLQKKFRQAGCAITVEQWTLLINIRNAGGQSQQQLAELVYLDKTTVARLAAGLEKKGLISRESVSADRRQKRLVITSRGTALLATLKPIALAAQQLVLQDLDPEKLKCCREVLRRVYDTILGQ
jgi:DNA-binding MarR family transcriptional regulator